MKDLLDISEIVDTREWDGVPHEICASAHARYEPDASQVEVTLDALVRRVHNDGPDEESRPDWLPVSERIREGVSRAEATDLVRDLFHRWTGKVRSAIPPAERLAFAYRTEKPKLMPGSAT